MSEVVNCQDVFVRNVKNLMIKHKLNQYTLADKVGLSQTGLRLILIGESNPTLKTMTAICDAFNVSMGDMFNPNVDQFGEQVSKDDEILELKQEIIRRDVQLAELNKKLASAPSIEVPKDDKVKVFMQGNAGTVITINGKNVDFDCIENVDIYNKTIAMQLKFDELSVK